MRIAALVAAFFVLAAAALTAPQAARADDPTFARAFGAGPADLCTTACRPGSNGSGAGQLSFPYGVATSGGELYVAEGNNHRISVYSASGAFSRAFGKSVNPVGGNVDVCTVASTCRAGAVGGGAAQLNSPYAVAISNGEVFVADASNNRIAVYTTQGTFSRAFGRNVNPTTTGSPDICTTSTGCLPGSAGSGPGQLSFPLGVAASNGELFVADSSNNRISVYSPAGAFLRTIGGPGSEAGQLSFPFGIAAGGGEIFVADQNNQRISVFTSAGAFARAFGKNVNPTVGSPDVCTTITGCRAGSAGAGPGHLKSPVGVAFQGGEVYVADSTQRVSVFATDGTFSRAFGKEVNPGPGDPDLCTTATGCQNATTGGAAGQLNSPSGVAVSAGEVFVADTANFRISVFSTAGVFSRAFGRSVWGASPFVCTTQTGCGPGAPGGAASQLNLPFAVAVSGGETYVADQTNHRISVYSAGGTFARAFGRDVNAGTTGNPDVCTSATTCRAGTGGVGAGQLNFPVGVAVSGGEVFVADQGSHRITVFATDGTFLRAFGKDVNAGSGGADVCTRTTTCRSGSLGGAAGQLDNPVAVAVSGGEVYVTDQGNRRISVFSTAGTFARAFGKGVNPGTGDPDLCSAATTCQPASGGGAAGQLDSPFGLTVSGSEVFVADHFNHRISVFSTGGAFVRAFGRGVNGGNGPADVCTAATTCRSGSTGGAAGQIAFPFGIGIGDGALYVSERFNARLSVFNPDGTFSSAFGRGVNPGSGNPDVCTAATTCRAAAQGDTAGQFMEPLGIAVSGTTIFVADRLIHRVSVFRVPRTELSRSPTALAFGFRDVDDGATATQLSTVTNTGTETVTVTGLTLSGDGNQFTRLTGGASDCTATSVLEPGDTCAIRVRFDPTTTGAKAATLTVASNAPAITVSLTGTGIQTALSAAPRSLSFGSHDLDDPAPPDQSATITNDGTEPIALAALTLSGDTAGFTRLTGNPGDCGTATHLAAGQSCAVRIRFDPVTTGVKLATLTVTSNADAVTIGLSGAGTQTELSRSPATLAFAARDVDDGPSAEQTSTITNTGSETVTLSTLAVTGATSQFARLTGGADDCAAATQLDAGQSCTVRFRFDPTTTGAKAATLTVTSNAPPVTVALTGTGTQVELARSPATLAFGTRGIDDGPAADLTSTVVNAGSEPVSLSSIALTGDTTQFTRLTGATSDCAAATQLAGGQSCTVRVRFDPTTNGPKAGTVTIGSTAGTLTIALTGIGVHMELDVEPGALEFGLRDVDTGATAAKQTTITNAGSDAVTLSALTLSGDAAHFARLSGGVGDCAITMRLDPGSSCVVRVRFDPERGGAKAATLNVESNARPLRIALTGTGIQTELSSDPPALAFGSIDANDGTAVRTATIANTGTEPVGLTGLSLSGDSGHFERLTGAPGDCTTETRLSAGETCAARVRFDPTAAGPISATLAVTSNASPVVVALTGTGTRPQVDPAGEPAPPPVVTPPPPPPAPTPAPRAWRLKRLAKPRVTVRGDKVLVASGYAAVCAADGPACRGRMTLKLLLRSSRSRRVIPIFLTGKAPLVTIQPGARHRILYRLSDRAVALLRRRGKLDVVLRGVVQVGDQRARARKARLKLVLPR
jgi:DNA-binding beta-propeller fold protein YncE